MQLPEPPDKPGAGDCCGNGCSPCVLDVYEKLYEKWKEECRQVTENKVESVVEDKRRTTVLSMTRYMPFQLVSSSRMSRDTNLYTFQAVILTGDSEGKYLVKGNEDEIRIQASRINCFPGQHLFLRGCIQTVDSDNSTSSDKNSIITRAYTPVSDPTDHAVGIFNVIIKLYERGKMSAFVKQLQVGDVTFWRGPYGSFRYKRNSFKYILMLCAGTGIAPMYSIAKHIVSDDDEDTIVRMVFVCKSMDDILLRDEIHSLRAFWNFSADVYLTCDASVLSPRYGEIIQKGRLGRDQVNIEVSKLGCEHCLVLICGPASFNESMMENVKDCNIPQEHLHVF